MRCSCTTTRCCAGLGAPEPIAAELLREPAGDRAEDPALSCDASGRSATRRAARRQAHALRRRAGHHARRRPRHLSLRHLLATPSSGRRRTGSGLGPAARRLRARHHQGLHHAGRRRPVPDRAHRRDRPTSAASAASEFGTVTGRPRRCGWFDAVLVRQAVGDRRHRRHRADQARRPRRLRRDPGLHRLRNPRAPLRPPAGRPPRCRPTPSRSTKSSKAGARITRGARSCAELPADGGQVRPPHRGADRGAGGAPLDQPRARRHDSGEGSLCGLSGLAAPRATPPVRRGTPPAPRPAVAVIGRILAKPRGPEFHAQNPDGVRLRPGAAVLCLGGDPIPGVGRDFEAAAERPSARTRPGGLPRSRRAGLRIGRG